MLRIQFSLNQFNTDKIEVRGIYHAIKNNEIEREFLEQLPRDTPLELRPKPTNKHDSHTVSVWVENKKMGYIAKEQNFDIFYGLQNNSLYDCFLWSMRLRMRKKGIGWILFFLKNFGEIWKTVNGNSFIKKYFKFIKSV